MLTTLFVLGVLAFVVAYFTYGRLLERWLQVSDERPTPAHTLRDDVDYCPTRVSVLFGHHFSSIAGAGPIVGPILATLYFGWLPAALWIIVGAILIGGVQDFTTLMASIRHRARSVAEIAREYMSPLSHRLFLTFIWLALVLVLIAFADLTSATFVGKPESGDEGVALSSLFYLGLALALGFTVTRLKIPLLWASLVAVPLVFLGIWLGQQLQTQVPLAIGKAEWNYILFGYCFVAATAPVWILLQPRDYLSGFLLYACLFAGLVGICLGGHELNYPAFKTWKHEQIGFLFPALFITIACGACSGFHSIVSSGTTSKQLAKESAGRPIGYGGMLVEGVLALVSVVCVIVVLGGSTAGAGGNPVAIFGQGIGRFTQTLGLAPEYGAAFGTLALSTFLLTTLDTCTRLGRYVLCEMVGFQGAAGRYLGTVLTLAIPALLVNQTFTAGGQQLPVYKAVWPVFGATNQLLGGLALMVITVWLRRTGRPFWFVALPALFMFAASTAALVLKVSAWIQQMGRGDGDGTLVGVTATGLLLLAAVLLFESIRVVFLRPPMPAGEAA